jgi:hypothetical protein
MAAPAGLSASTAAARCSAAARSASAAQGSCRDWLANLKMSFLISQLVILNMESGQMINGIVINGK